MPSISSKENINNSFFDGQYKDLWRSFIPEELTKRELDFIFQYFNLRPGNKVLDIMCGYGRHAIALARKGMHVTAVDNLSDYIDDIHKTVVTENLSLQHIQSDILNFKTAEKFDLVICMGNSINFFNEKDCLVLMQSVADSLNPGGKFLINSWSLAEIIIKNFTEKSWSDDGDYKILTDSEFLFNPTRMETDFFIIDKDGNTEIKKAIDYIFSISEMQRMLEASGFILEEVYSIPGKKKFALGEPRAYIIAEKKAI
ncbi:MAG: class I SAM-dependent methyltransferase [Bacteroidota bacterium]